MKPIQRYPCDVGVCVGVGRCVCVVCVKYHCDVGVWVGVGVCGMCFRYPCDVGVCVGRCEGCQIDVNACTCCMHVHQNVSTILVFV